MGRASYCETDSYAPKASRLSEIAPRPQVDEGGERRSKRRKMRPLQYWRGERVDYARASGAAVPEGVRVSDRARGHVPPVAPLTSHLHLHAAACKLLCAQELILVCCDSRRSHDSLAGGNAVASQAAKVAASRCG